MQNILDEAFKRKALDFFESKLSFLAAMLRGISQIFLQESALTGFLLIFGIFYDLKEMGIAAIVSVFTATLTAKVLKYDKENLRKGLYGFSATLLGVALTFYFEPHFIIWSAIIVGSILATILQNWFIKKKIIALTFPFVLLAWIFVFIFHNVYPIPDSALLYAKGAPIHDYTDMIKGFGEVVFQSSTFSSTLFFIAIFITSPLAALYGIAASVLGVVLSAQFSASIEDVEIGLYSFNAVLSAIYFSGDKPKDGIWVFIAVSIAVMINVVMVEYDLLAFTFPFVAACFLTQQLKIRINNYLEHASIFKKHP